MRPWGATLDLLSQHSFCRLSLPALPRWCSCRVRTSRRTWGGEQADVTKWPHVTIMFLIIDSSRLCHGGTRACGMYTTRIKPGMRG